MTRSQFEEEPDHPKGIDPSTASRMLAEATRVSANVRRLADPRIQSLIQTWVPVVVFAYAATFLLIFTAPESTLGASTFVSGPAYTGILMVPLLSQVLLVEGARNRITVSEAMPLQGRKLVFVLLGIAAFIAIAAVSVSGVEVPWWLCILAAACAAVPPGILAKRSRSSARQEAVITAEPASQSSPSRTARIATACLGIYFGVAGASTVFSWFPAALLLLVLLLLTLIFARNTRWGLTSVGSEWQQQHWKSFGATFLLFFGLLLVVVRTTWNTPMVGIIGGVLIAAPMIAASLTIRRAS